MCGIVSVISKRNSGFWSADLDLFEGLLVLDTLRGLDSTGVFCVDSARQVGFMKIASHPYHLFGMQEYPKWRQQAVSRGRILVGHNRKATQGSINSANAHPFHSGNILMVHNGTLRMNHRKELADVDVDSHALTIAIDERGAENVLPEINGAFALVWWDVSKNSLFVVRNNERPLQVVETDEAYFVLSEGWMALQLLAREHKKILNTFDIPAGTLYEFKLGGQFTTKTLNLKKYEPTVTNITGRMYPQQQSGYVPSVPTGKPQDSPNSPLAGGPSKTTTSPSKQQGALTVVKAPPSGEAPDPATTTNTPLPVDMAHHVPCDEFTRGMTVLIKLYEMKLDEKGQLYFCRGKVVEPNTPEIDVTTYIKVSDIPTGQTHLYVTEAVEGVVVKHTTSICGRSLYLNKITLPEYVETYNRRLAETEWNYVTAYCKCAQCDAQIFEEEREFTSVLKRPNNQYTITCAQCVEDNLKGAAKHEFNQSRLAAVQAHVGERDPSGGSTGNQTGSSGSPTLH